MSGSVLELQLKEKIPPRSRWVIALSGGADSVALLRLLCSLREELSLTLFAAHVHHGLRQTADRDLAFVRRLCREQQVPLYSVRVQADRIAEQQGLSLEAAGRVCRYDFLLPLANRLQAQVATAHTLNDQAETVLLYLLRGNGPEGLGGIREQRRDGVFRPLLDYTKETLLAYLNQLGQPHCEDETNLSDAFLRNRIRHHLLPMLTEWNPSFLQGVARSVKLLQEDNDYLQTVTRATLDAHPDGRFPLPEMQELHPAVRNRLIRLAAKDFCGENNLSTTETEQINNLILRGANHRSRPIGKNGEVRICNDSVNFLKTVEKPKEVWYNITVPQKVKTPWGDIEFLLTDTRPETGLVMDFDKVKTASVLRSRQAGDRIAIGKNARQKISDLLINAKVPAEERDKTLVLCDGEQIFALFPYRVAYDAAPTEDTTHFLSMLQRSDCDEPH